MKYQRIVVGPLAANCYLAWCQKTDEGVIIDPGDDFEYIANEIKRLGIKPIKILATHGHFDHILAVNELKLAYHIPFLIHPKDMPVLARARRMCQFFCHFDPGPPPGPDGNISQGDNVQFGGEHLEVIETPGHTHGGVCFFGQKDSLLFCGDIIFAHGGVGRTDLKEGDQKLLMESIRKKIFSLPEETILLPGHGEETTVGKEKTLTP